MTMYVRRPLRGQPYVGPQGPGHLPATIVLSKHDGVLRAVDLGGYETRHESVLRLVASADREHRLPAFGPVSIWTGDKPICRSQAWRSLAFCTAPEFADVPVPDFIFVGWPQVRLDDYERTCAEVAAAGAEPAEHPTVGWLGNCDMHSNRWKLRELAQRHPGLVEAEHVAWVPGTGRTSAGTAVSLEDQVRRWAFLIDVEGLGYSGRLKLLLHSGRPVFVQDRPWREWWWEELTPMVHFIPVRRDLGDLADRVRWAQAHGDEAEAIGRAGQVFARARLTRAGAVRRWAEVLRDLAASPYIPYAPRQRLLLGRVLYAWPAARPA